MFLRAAATLTRLFAFPPFFPMSLAVIGIEPQSNTASVSCDSLTRMDSNSHPLRHSMSPISVIDIRYGTPLKQESNQQLVTRMALKYGRAEQDIRLLMALDDDLIDGVGRMAEDE